MSTKNEWTGIEMEVLTWLEENYDDEVASAVAAVKAGRVNAQFVCTLDGVLDEREENLYISETGEWIVESWSYDDGFNFWKLSRSEAREKILDALKEHRKYYHNCHEGQKIIRECKKALDDYFPRKKSG